MIKGTTPTLNFKFPSTVDMEHIDEINIIFSQNGQEIFDKTLNDCTVDGHTLKLKLDSDDTLNLSERDSLQIQLGILFDDGTIGASYILETDVYPILRDGGLI